MSTKPNSSITLHRYNDLLPIVRAFAQGKLNLLVIVGPPGVEKSRMLRDHTNPKKVGWIVGNASALGVFMRLHEFKDKLIVIDDVDGLYEDKVAVRLLKSLCNTEETKTLQWESSSNILVGNKIPKTFETRSKLCLLANRWRSLNINVQAIEDRGHIIFFEPTAEEIHHRVEKMRWFADKEVFRWIGQNLHFIPEPSMRQYLRAVELKAAGVNWKLMLLNQWLRDESMRVLIEIVCDQRFTTQDQRWQEFVKRGAGSRATYFRKFQEFQHRKRGSPVMPEAAVSA